MAGQEPQRRVGRKAKGNGSIGLEGEHLVVADLRDTQTGQGAELAASKGVPGARSAQAYLGMTTIESNGQRKRSKGADMAGAWVRRDHAQGTPPIAWAGEESTMAEPKASSTNRATLRDKVKGYGWGGGRWRRVEPRAAEVSERGL